MKYNGNNQNTSYDVRAPNSVTCLSPIAEVFKISAVEFHRKVMKEPRSLNQLIENLANKLKIGEEKIAKVQKQRLATDMDKFFGHDIKQRTLVDDEQLDDQRVLLQKNIDERT